MGRSAREPRGGPLVTLREALTLPKVGVLGPRENEFWTAMWPPVRGLPNFLVGL